MDEDLVGILRTQREKAAQAPPPSPDEVKRTEEEARQAAEAFLEASRQATSLPELKFERVELDEVEPIGPIEVVVVEPDPARAPRKPAHRMPEGIPIGTMRRIKALLEQGELSQQNIADADGVGLNRSRIQRHRALMLAGWDLIRSDPDFRSVGANDGMVYLPSLAKARQLLTEARSGSAAD